MAEKYVRVGQVIYHNCGHQPSKVLVQAGGNGKGQDDRDNDVRKKDRTIELKTLRFSVGAAKMDRRSEESRDPGKVQQFEDSRNNVVMVWMCAWKNLKDHKLMHERGRRRQ